MLGWDSHSLSSPPLCFFLPHVEMTHRQGASEALLESSSWGGGDSLLILPGEKNQAGLSGLGRTGPPLPAPGWWGSGPKPSGS